ncbi:unnamed protein product [Heligmosomoides polygyrus]|uniref:Reverse transcriptase domain-containing protein n=1 Tax=Heligmosomoides polygyrus TaxID=6339 RepID=A0A183GCL9_HELPZ|nr:unnamed protein product [Heligmosomoides polygyrus]
MIINAIGLTETRRHHPLQATYDSGEELFLGTCDSRGVGGVGVLVNTHLAMNIDSYESLTSRIGRLRLKRCGSVPALTVFVAYAPTSVYDDEEVEAFYVELEKFYKEDHTFYKECKVPSQWKTSRTVLLYKKGDVHDIGNYRPICLLSVVYKLFTRVVPKWISRTLDEGQPCEQAGFRRGFSTIDHIHTITKLIEVSQEYKLPLCFTFIDLKKAFDSVETEAPSKQSAAVPYVHRPEEGIRLRRN